MSSEREAVRAIERTLVDYFDHFGNGTIVENEGREWFLRFHELEISLTELAFALASPLPHDKEAEGR